LYAFTPKVFDGRVVRVMDWEAMWARTTQVKVREYKLLPYCEPNDIGANNIVGRLTVRRDLYAARGFTIVTELPTIGLACTMLNNEIVRERQIEVARTEMYSHGVPMRTLPLHHQRAYRMWVAMGYHRWNTSWDRIVKQADEEQLRCTQFISSWPWP
jgi:hypothetical protein